MPRVSLTERQRSLERVEEYLAPFFCNPSADQRTLSISGICRAIKISPATLKKHGLISRIAEAQRVRKSFQRSEGNRTVVRLKAQLWKSREECGLWKSRYETLLEQYLRIEYHLRQSPAIDLDSVLATALPRPARSRPRKSRRRPIR